MVHSDTSPGDKQRTGSDPDGTFLVFCLDDLRFGLRLDVVDEVLPSIPSSPLPEAPDAVEGIVTVRGELLSVFDIRRRFGLEQRPPRVDDHLILARTEQRRVLVRVDRALEIIETTRQPEPPPLPEHDGDEAICGVSRDEDGVWYVHDLNAFLLAEENDQLERALARERDAEEAP